MADTQLNIINAVQRRLREDETASISTNEYSVLLGDLLNETIAEINEAHDWTAWDDELTVTVVASTATYVVTNSTNESQLRYLNNAAMASFAETGETKGRQLVFMHPDALWACQQGDTSLTDDNVVYFTLRPQSDANVQELEIWPTPTVGGTISLRMWTPMASLAVDGTADATTIYFDTQLLQLGVLYRAYNERGEEIGEPGHLAEKRYYSRLTDLVFKDMTNRMKTNEYEFWSD